MEVTTWTEALWQKDRFAIQRTYGPERVVNAEQASKLLMRKPTLHEVGEGRRQFGKRATQAPSCFRRGNGTGTYGR